MQLLVALLPVLLAGTATFVGIFGSTWDADRHRLTRLGWVTLIVGAAGLVLGLASTYSVYRDKRARVALAYTEFDASVDNIGRNLMGTATAASMAHDYAAEREVFFVREPMLRPLCQHLSEVLSRYQGELEPRDIQDATSVQDLCESQASVDTAALPLHPRADSVPKIEGRVAKYYFALAGFTSLVTNSACLHFMQPRCMPRFRLSTMINGEQLLFTLACSRDSTVALRNCRYRRSLIEALAAGAQWRD